MIRVCTIAAFAILATFSTSSLSQQRPTKVLLLYDMEGVSDATDWRKTNFRHPADYADGRRSLTADVNAAISGLRSAGATEILVVDGHGSQNDDAPDVLEDQLLPPANHLYRETEFDEYVGSYDQSFDAIVAIGMHAGAGNSAGFLSHTWSAEDVRYEVNGIPFNESMLVAALAARFMVPLIMVSGDDELEKEVRAFLPWVRYATVKHAVNRVKAESFSRDEVSRRIEAAAREALQNLAGARLPDWSGPFRFSLTFQDEAQASAAAMVSGAVMINPRTVEVRGNDFEEAYLKSVRLITIAHLVGWNTAQEAVLNSQSSAVPLSVRVTEWWYDRWLDQLPASPSAPRNQLARHWGPKTLAQNSPQTA